MKVSRQILLLCIIIPVFAYCQPDNIKFEHITSEQGLSMNTVVCILQDHDGFMWFGTQDGLNKYDGYSFTIYKHDAFDTTSISNSNIYSLCEDHTGALWIGTYGGLNRFDRKKNQFIHYLNDPTNPHTLSNDIVYVAYEVHNGTLWIGTANGLNKYDREKNEFKRFMHNSSDPFSLTEGRVGSICEDSIMRNTMWIGTSGGLDRFDRSTETFVHFGHDPNNLTSLSHDRVQAIVEDKAGIVWIATWGGGINRFNRERGDFTRFRNDPTDTRTLSGDDVLALCAPRRDSSTLWVGTLNGLDRLDYSNNHFVHFSSDPLIPTSLNNYHTISLYEDRAGTLWIGTWGGGVNKIDPARQRFAHYFKNPHSSNTVSDNEVWSISTDQAGNLWIGTEGGLNKLNRASGKFVHFRHDPNNPHSLSHDRVWSIREDHTGILWVGTEVGLNRLDRRTGRFTRFLRDTVTGSLSNDRIPVILEDRAGTLWFGTNDGVYSLDRETGKFISLVYDTTRKPGDDSGVLYAMYEDHLGNLWIATAQGLYEYDRIKNRFTAFFHDPQNPHSLTSSNVGPICEDQNGTLWFGGDGLNRFDRERGEFVHYSEKDGLPDNSVWGILEDDDGSLWLSTNKELSRFDPRTNSFHNYDVADGLQSNEFNILAYHKNKTGEMFFGGINGFNSFFPSQIKDNPLVPPVVITSFKKFSREAVLDTSISRIKNITLNYDENVFSFAFAALNYTNTPKNQYAYRMEGFDRDWVPSGTKREVTYTNLDPGEYVFRVKGSNNDGIWNEAGTSVRVIILPPYWKTWWFRSLIILALVTIAYGAYRYRVAQLIKVERLRLRIASDLHDDVGSNLSSISLGSQLVLRRSSLDQETRQLIEEIREDAAETAETMKDIVWLINPRNDQLEDLLLRMKDVAAKLLHDTEYSFHAPTSAFGGLPSIADLSIRRNIFLIYKESLNNIAKHAKATQVEISLTHNDGRLVLSIKDNGVGFDPSIPQKGNGLAGFERRAEAIGGTIRVDSTPGAGTTVSLTVPIP